jgi:hypothetical protein
MKIDIDALRQIEREKGLDFQTVVEAFEVALGSAYKRSAHASADEARVVVDRVTGEVTVLCPGARRRGQRRLRVAGGASRLRTDRRPDRQAGAAPASA